MNLTVCPAMRGRFGDWTYWYTTRRVRDVLANVKQPNASVMDVLAFDERVQRQLVEGRIDPMVEYLHRSKRFFGPLIVGVSGLEPDFTPIKVDIEGLPIRAADIGFGTLTFSGDQSLQVLDGQHRLAALRRGCESISDLLTDTLGVVIVPISSDADGLQKARRLFTHINRYAKSTTISENILTDEDDAIAIVSRRLSMEHPLLQGRTWIKSPNLPNNAADHGIRSNECVTTLVTVYRCTEELLKPFVRSVSDLKRYRPEEGELEKFYSCVTQFWDSLVSGIPEMQQVCRKKTDPGQFRPEDKRRKRYGHLLFRPVGQIALAKCLAMITAKDRQMPPFAGTYSDVVNQVGKMKLKLQDRPWQGVFYSKGRMNTNDGRIELGADLLTHMLGMRVRKGLLERYRKAVFVDARIPEARRLRLPPKVS